MCKNTHFIVLSGPTAVGKSSMAISIAEEFRIPIISADSRQVFRELSIGTAKPSPLEQNNIPHFWIDEKSIKEDVSAGIFIEDVKSYLDKNEIKLAILCGGTQFYIDSFLYGLDDKPDIPQWAKNEASSIYSEKGLIGLQEEVKKRDSVYYNKVDNQNHRRLLRALEVILTTGKPYSFFHTERYKSRNSLYPYISYFLTRDRKPLYNRINRRVDIMIEMGLESEAQQLYSERNNINLQTVGYREFFQYFDGSITREEAIHLIKRNTRRYAKRQLTWYNKSRFNYLKRQATDRDSLLKEIKLFLLLNGI